MLSKLKNLLFEDEDEEYEDEEQEEVTQPAKKQTQAAPQQKPASNNQGYSAPRQEQRSTMPRIDLTQSFERVNPDNRQQTQVPMNNVHAQQDSRMYTQQYNQSMQNYQQPNYQQPNYQMPNSYQQRPQTNYQQPQNGYQQNAYQQPQTAYQNSQYTQQAYNQPPVYQAPEQQYTQQAPSRHDSAYQQRTQSVSLPRHDVRAFGQEPVVQERRQPSINVDSYVSRPQSVQPAPVQPEPAPKPKKVTPAYEFQPVISPIFGVDEKDLSALKTAGTRTSTSSDSHVAEIISPIYGLSIDAQPSNIQSSVEKSNAVEQIAATPAAKEAEEEIPEISLDAILRSKDDDFTAESVHTPMLNKSLYTDEMIKKDEEEIDNTTVLDTDDFSFPSLRIDE